MKKITVNLGERSYKIIMGKRILNSASSLLKKLGKEKKIAIVTNPIVNSLVGNKLKENLEVTGIESVVLEVPDSETSKSLEQAADLYKRLIENALERSSCIIALGGGVIGDLAGFVAATYMRGINLVQIPTTLLAQVDSSIGGKVGIDLPEGKNLIGTFYQPKLVLIDVEILKTLPEREINSGFAEIVKYGIIADSGLFELVEKNVERIKNLDEEILVQIISKCCKIKAAIVEKDELDKKNLRIILNLGHTLGHALEAITNYTKYSHGEAISIGIVFAAKISNKLGMLKMKDLKRIVNLLEKIGLPTSIDRNLDLNQILERMRIDKKVVNEDIRFALIEKIGKVKVVDKVPEKILIEILEEMQK